MERCRIRMSWEGNRKESPEECARHTSKLIQGLAALDPMFSLFETTLRVRGKYVHQALSPDEQLLAKLFAQGVNRRDSDRTVIEELGFRLAAVTRHKQNYASLEVQCGVYNPRLGNGCALELPSHEPEAGRLINIPMLTAILRLMAECFEPELGNAGFSKYRLAVAPQAQRNREYDVDWIMYFSRAWGTVPPLPAPVRIEPVGDSGALVILTPEPISAANPEHVALGLRVRELLNRAGLLAWRGD